MRTLAIIVLALCPALLLGGQRQRQPKANPSSPCGKQSKGVSDFYYEAVLERIEPPSWGRPLIKIVVGGEIKLGLWTDGEKFELLTNMPPTPRKNVGDFLNDLDDSCRLPPNPADAVALMNLKWESKELSADQFAQLHRDFIRALAQYVAKMQDRYSSMISTRLYVIHLDSEGYSVVYDNSHEHVDIEAWNENEDHPVSPMIDWVHELQKLAEDSFHRPFGRKTPQ